MQADRPRRKLLNQNSDGLRPYVVHYDHVLGTSLDLQVIASGTSVARRAEAAVLAEVDRLEPLLSGWPDSDEFTRCVINYWSSQRARLACHPEYRVVTCPMSGMCFTRRLGQKYASWPARHRSVLPGSPACGPRC